MATVGQVTVDGSNVAVVFCPGPPRRYVARFGVTGWSEAWGWSETEAVSNLARVLMDDPPEHDSVSLSGDLLAVIAWLRSGYDLPTLET